MPPCMGARKATPTLRVGRGCTSALRFFSGRRAMSDPQNQFYEWNYDEGVVILYERLGECNGCGDCCMAAIQFAVAGRLTHGSKPWEQHGNGGSDTTASGVWSEVRVGE